MPETDVKRRAAVTIMDQIIASASNFLVGVVVARIAGPAGLGAYAVAYALWLLLAAIHRAIITDPMAIGNDIRREDSSERLRAGLAAELLLGAVVALLVGALSIPVILLGQRNVGIALLTLAPFFPVLLVQDYWRWAGFMRARPGLSLANDVVFNCVQGALLIALIVGGFRSASTAIVAWGIGAVAGALYGLRQFSVSVRARGGYSFVAARWPTSKWLLADGLTTWSCSQAYPLFAGPFLGAESLGGLKAAQSLVSGPTNVLIQAGGSIGLPEASHRFDKFGWAKLQQVARWVLLWGALSVGFVGVVVFVAGARLLTLVYGSEFAKYETAARIVSLSWVVLAFAAPAILILKVTRNTRALFRSGLMASSVLIVGLVTLSRHFGVNGAAFAMVLGNFVYVILLKLSERVVTRPYAAEVRSSQ
jgi:O-antigen/teichoic acid export membrane protein